MKILKFYIKQTVFFVALFPILQLRAQETLTMSWGLENTKFFQEYKSTQEQNPALHPDIKKKDSSHRAIGPNAKYNEVIQEFFQRHEILWKDFIKDKRQNEEPSKLEFIKFASEKDDYFVGLTKSLAPTLYFDFIGLSKEYVLESITISTINFNEYQGGGFSINEAWYDIELKHKVGEYTYNVDKKLKFTGSGRAILRFWSDNYSPRHGMTPSGDYKINIKFNFLVDGKKVSVSTGIFNMDV